jgi:hypothetical protein
MKRQGLFHGARGRPEPCFQVAKQGADARRSGWEIAIGIASLRSVLGRT